jgi:hypothetical protein
MVMVPPGTNLKALTPQVECAPGSFITSPVPAKIPPAAGSPPVYDQGEIDFTAPTIWTAQARNGAVQQYTVVVSSTPVTSTEKRITYFFFQEFPQCPAVINQTMGTIDVVVPYGTKATNANYDLTPVIAFVGKQVTYEGTNPESGPLNCDGTDGTMSFVSTATPALHVYDVNDNSKDYAVMVLEAANPDAEITGFAIEGYPDVIAAINQGSSGGQGTITAKLPYGASLANLNPLVNYKGKTLDPVSGTAQNFNFPVLYTVRSWDNTHIKEYTVTITNEEPEGNTGIFDFVITNVPAAKVVIGQKPRQDGKIPIVVQIPYYPPADDIENHLIPAITLAGSGSKIYRADQAGTKPPASGEYIPFGNLGNNQEAVYTVEAESGITQQYVVVVSMGGQYYYVNGDSGSDTEPDYYTGESENRAFKTLAYAVKKASDPGSTITHIFVSGELNSSNQSGSKTDPSAYVDSGSVIAINGTGSPAKTITVTGVGNNATLRGTTGKRVLSIGGGADLVFENITVTGGRAATGADGGGLHISGKSKVKFSGGGITDNSARSGGGVFVGTDNTDKSEFTLMGGSINGNSATGTATGADSNGMWTTSPPSIAGGGGVCVSGNGLFWLASGTLSNNTTSGSGGGVLVRGLRDFSTPNNDSGFLMSGGSVTKNSSTGNSSPHGGGGVYVASGDFSMAGGGITLNTSVRQGGGVFVHSGASFEAWGNSSITGNEGVGSSKAICSRGQTTLRGNAQADTIYVWNPLAADAGATGGNQHKEYNKFGMGENARVKGIVLAYSAEYRNYIDIYDSIPGSDQIGIIDLEGHLTNYKFVDTDINDWLNKAVLRGGSGAITAALLKRFPLGVFVGGSLINLSTYQLSVADFDAGHAPAASPPLPGKIGKLAKK